MAYECFAVLHQDARGRGTRHRLVSAEKPDGFHTSEREAEAARKRWQERYPRKKWRVAHLKEA
jgi:hypothetical protein